MKTPRILSAPARRLLGSILITLALIAPVSAEPAASPAADAVVVADTVVASDAGPAVEPANCQSAIDRQARLAKAASDKRARKAAISAAQYTIDEAKRIAASYREGQGVNFLRASERRGKAHLEKAVSARVDRIPSFTKPLCVALANRDAAACKALSSSDRAACEAWLSLRAGVASGCKDLTGEAKGGCQAATTDLSCAELAADEKRGCARVRGAEALRRAKCQDALEPTTCTWALLVHGLGLSDPKAACAPVSPSQGGRSPAHHQVLTTCRAVLEERAVSCPDDARGALQPITVFTESQVVAQQSGARVVTNLQTYEPAVCEVTLSVSRGEKVEGRRTVVVSTDSWVSQPVWSDFAIGEGEGQLVASAQTTCAPRASWTVK